MQQSKQMSDVDDYVGAWYIFMRFCSIHGFMRYDLLKKLYLQKCELEHLFKSITVSSIIFIQKVRYEDGVL